MEGVPCLPVCTLLDISLHSGIFCSWLVVFVSVLYYDRFYASVPAIAMAEGIKALYSGISGATIGLKDELIRLRQMATHPESGSVQGFYPLKGRVSLPLPHQVCVHGGDLFLGL